MEHNGKEWLFVADDDTAELRIDLPKAWLAVLDAQSMARGGSAVASRKTLLLPVIGAYIEQSIKEANMVGNVLRGNPLMSESRRQASAPPMEGAEIDGLVAQLHGLLSKHRA